MLTPTCVSDASLTHPGVLGHCTCRGCHFNRNLRLLPRGEKHQHHGQLQQDDSPGEQQLPSPGLGTTLPNNRQAVEAGVTAQLWSHPLLSEKS